MAIRTRSSVSSTGARRAPRSSPTWLGFAAGLGLCGAFGSACGETSATDGSASANAGATPGSDGPAVPLAPRPDASVAAVPAEPPLALPPASTTLVLPAAPTAEETLAAALLQDWMRRAARSTEGFPIVAEPAAPAAGVLIMIGATARQTVTDLQILDEDGIVLRRRDRVITLTGGARRGVYLAAVRFLDVECGVRFYLPGDDFTSLPADPALAARGADVRENPRIRSSLVTGIAGIGGEGPPGEGEWSRRNGLDNRRRGGSHQHNIDDVFPKDVFAARFPSLFGQNGIPCFSDSSALEAGEESARSYFAANPDHEYLAFSVNDTSDRCERDPADDAAYSAVYWGFMNALAARLQPTFPEKRLLGLAYAGVRVAPTAKLHPNVVVFTNLHVSELEADQLLAPGGALASWTAVASHYGNHEWAFGMGFLIPRIYTGYFERFLDTASTAGVDMGYHHTEAYPNYGLDGPKLYVMGQSLWGTTEPDLAWTKLTADLFGAAGPSMREYFGILEQVWTQWDNVEGPERKLYGWGNQFTSTPVSLALFRSARAAMDRGLAAEPDPAVQARIGLFSKTFALSERLVEQAARGTAAPGFIDETMQYLETQLIPDKRTLFRRSDDALRADVAGALAAVTQGKPAP